jgi:hypothetical protein
MRPVCALSPHPTIGRSTDWSRLHVPLRGPHSEKVIVRCQLVVPSSSSDDYLPLVKHDARVDLTPSGKRIRYT